jgi:hypothetical protein
MSKSVYTIREEEREEREGRKMVKDHKKRTKNQPLKEYKVPKDPCNTRFLCPTEERGQRAVANHIHRHKDFWK